MQNLLRRRDAVRAKGITGRVVLNGSFISAKPDPGDFDMLLVYDEKHQQAIATDDELRAMLDPIKAKRHFSGDVFAFSTELARTHPYLFSVDTFDRMKVTLAPKGVVEVDL